MSFFRAYKIICHLTTLIWTFMMRDAWPPLPRILKIMYVNLMCTQPMKHLWPRRVVLYRNSYRVTAAVFNINIELRIGVLLHFMSCIHRVSSLGLLHAFSAEQLEARDLNFLKRKEAYDQHETLSEVRTSENSSNVLKCGWKNLYSVSSPSPYLFLLNTIDLTWSSLPRYNNGDRFYSNFSKALIFA